MHRSTAGNRKRRPRSKAAVTLIALLALAASALAIAPAGASAMIDENPCKKGPSGVWKTAGGQICIVLDGAAIPLEVIEASDPPHLDAPPISGLPHQITPGGRPASGGEHPHLGGRGSGSGGAIPKVPKKEIWNARMCAEAKAEMDTLLTKIQGANKKTDDEGWRKRREMLGDQFRDQGCAAKLEEAKKEKEAAKPTRVTGRAEIGACQRLVHRLVKARDEVNRRYLSPAEEEEEAVRRFELALKEAEFEGCIVVRIDSRRPSIALPAWDNLF